VTLGGIEMENDMYGCNPIKVKFLYGTNNFEMILEGCLRFQMI
jgi:hypothetical protein